MSSPVVHVFCGTSVSTGEAARIIPGAELHPPAWAGDLPLLKAGPGDVVVLLDGAVHHADPVRHGEILALLAAGTTVIGAAGLGAVRAAELRAYGMTGAGTIYGMLLSGSISDTEAVSAPVPLGPPAPQAVPGLLAEAAACLVISPGDARLLLSRRTAAAPGPGWAAVDMAAGPGLPGAAARFRAWYERRVMLSRARDRDARSVLGLVDSGTLPAPRAPRPLVPQPAVPPLPRRRPLPLAGDSLLPWQLRPWQLCDPQFPGRWARLVLARAGAAAAPVDAARLTAAQLGYWLTPAEIAALDPAAKAARILVRAVALDPAAPVWPLTGDDTDTLAGPGPAPGCPGSISGPVGLARIWDIQPGDTQALTAAARDRGFSTPGSAIRACQTARGAAGRPPGPPGLPVADE